MNENSATELYDFFSTLEQGKCYFTGNDVSDTDRISVFPDWLMERYQLSDKYMGMLNWNRVRYGELFLPCHPEAAGKIHKLEETICAAFEKGYAAVKELDPDLIFLWMARLLLGILYHDIEYSKEFARKHNKVFTLSPLLTRKYRDLHFMMQRIVRPVRWTERPYTLIIKELRYSKDIFNFRDETKNQNFSLGMNGFGLIACLQDRGLNETYHHDLLQKMKGVSLHAIQFEELAARFIYSNYLLHQQAEWNCIVENDAVVMSPEVAPIAEFRQWDDKMYASVLEDYWKPWGIEPKDIYTFPDSPMSFLINENNNSFIQPEDISLPT